MSLAGSIDEPLWLAVQRSYESGDYSGAITDSVVYLSELIRNKSGLDSDGNTLIGSAFGGPTPVIKVNTLHTDSERDEQRGVEQLLRGIYTAIRNPRIHEKRTDSVETADIIITFIGWVAGLIDKSKSPFDTEQIIRSVFDKHFAQNERYADLLVERTPKRKRLDVLVTVFQRRQEGNYRCVSLFIQALIKALPPEEQDEFWRVVSEALEDVSVEAEFRSIIQVVEWDWTRVAELPRIRAEHRMIQSIKEGEYDSSRETCLKGNLGTWAMGWAEKFTLQNELVSAISGRLYSSPTARAYAFKYFFYTYRKLRPRPPQPLVNCLTKLLKDEHDHEVYEALNGVAIYGDEDDPWVVAFREAVDQFNPSTSPEQSPEISDDDIPF